MNSIENLIEQASSNMFDPVLNFEIAKKYEELGQTSAAVSFYLRAAEYGYFEYPLIVYSSLIRMAFCFEDQSWREHSVTNCLMQAIEHIPYRPEAYFLLSRFYERTGKWQECYTFAEIGLMFAHVKDYLPILCEYPGKNGLLFEKAVSGWWVGRKEESKKLFHELLNSDIDENYKNTIKYNLQIIDQ